MKWDKLNVFTSHPSPLKGSSHFTQYTFHVIDTWQRSLLLTFYGFLFFLLFYFLFFCMFRVHKGQGCMMSLLGHSLISNIYKTHMSHQCHLEREGNFNANTGAFLKDVDVNHQAVTGSVRDDWRGPRGLAVGETMAGCVKTLRKSNAPGEVQECRTSNRTRCDNVAKPLINGTNVSALFVSLIFRPLRPRGFLPPEL